MTTKRQIKETNFLAIISAAFIVVLAFTMYLTKIYNSEASIYQREILNIEKQSESTEVTSIETDLENTDLSNLDKELTDIEKELESAELE